MTTPFRYKTQSEVTDLDRGDYLVLIDGKVPHAGLPLVHSQEVRLEPLSRRRARDAVYSSDESAHNRPSSRRNAKIGRTLEKGIQLYRLWFRFLKLALELEQMDVDLVVKRHTWITNKVDVPADVLGRSAKERREKFAKSGKTAGQFTGDSEKVFRCKVVEKVRVNRDAYEGWDLDQVLTQSFDNWWLIHSHLFEGRLPELVASKRDWIDHPDYLYIRIDKTAQWRDVAEFLRTEVSKQMRGKRASFAVSGKNPRVKQTSQTLHRLPLPATNDRGMYPVLGSQLRRRHLTPDRLQRDLRLEIRTVPFSCRLHARFLASRESLAPCPTFRDHLTLHDKVRHFRRSFCPIGRCAFYEYGFGERLLAAH
jgi:hypothetical protein